MVSADSAGEHPGREVTIGRRKVGSGHPVFMVAELSGNHHQSFETAVKMVEAAAEAGADAVKLQTYTADTITLDCDSEIFRIGGGTEWDGETLHSLYSRSATPWEWQPKLKEVAEDHGLELFSSPFDPTAVDFLEKMNVPAYKIASFELVDIPLIQHAATKGKPLIMSTGMASLGEIEEAVDAARDAGCREIVLLKCTSAYPADPAEMNLRTIPHLAQAFDVPVGLSDHSTGIAVPVAATALGVVMIEKHLTLSCADGGPESGFALEPAEFKAMVEAVRVGERALGMVHYGLTERDEGSRVFRRSLFVVYDVREGEPFTNKNVRSIRPAHGLPPVDLERVLGRTALCNLEIGTPLSWDVIS